MSNPRKKRKSRDTDEETIDRLYKEIRELRSLNRSLLKRLKKVDRDYQKALDSTEDEELPRKFEEAVQRAIACPNCSKGLLQVVELMGRQFSRCDTCDYRSKAKKL